MVWCLTGCMGSGKTTIGRLVALAVEGGSPSEERATLGAVRGGTTQQSGVVGPNGSEASEEGFPPVMAPQPLSFIDLDSFIEKQQGRKVQEIFAKQGEAAFRRMELEALQEAVSSYEGGTLLIALGGGTLMTPECRELVRLSSHCIYLRATAKTLAERLQGASDASGLHDAISSRPLLAGPGSLEDKLAALLAVRGPVYESTAQHIIDTDGLTPSAIASQVQAIIFGAR